MCYHYKKRVVFEVPELKSNINHIGKALINCPSCNSVGEFLLFYTNMSVSIASVSILPFHKRVSALCPKCNKIFYIENKKAEKYLIDRKTLIFKTDLIDKKGNKNA